MILLQTLKKTTFLLRFSIFMLWKMIFTCGLILMCSLNQHFTIVLMVWYFFLINFITMIVGKVKFHVALILISIHNSSIFPIAKKEKKDGFLYLREKQLKNQESKFH